MSISNRPAANAGALVLASCLAAGLVVAAHPTDPGRLRVSPPERLTVDLRAGLLLHRDAVLSELAASKARPEPPPEDEPEPPCRALCPYPPASSPDWKWTPLNRPLIEATLRAAFTVPDDRYGTRALLGEVLADIGLALSRDEDYTERAAILEYEAGMSREVAEAEARRLVYG